MKKVMEMKTPKKLITNKQMDICNDLFELGFTFNQLSPNGNVFLSKRTKLCVVEVVLSPSGAINGDDPYMWMESIRENSIMVAPEPVFLSNLP
jgi:hypothetical protein